MNAAIYWKHLAASNKNHANLGRILVDGWVPNGVGQVKLVQAPLTLETLFPGQ